MVPELLTAVVADADVAKSPPTLCQEIPPFLSSPLKALIQVASFNSAGAPAPPGVPALEAPSPNQIRLSVMKHLSC